MRPSPPESPGAFSPFPQAEPLAGTLQVRLGALVRVSRMTRPVKIPARGRQPGQAATVQCLAEQATGCLHAPTDGAGY